MKVPEFYRGNRNAPIPKYLKPHELAERAEDAWRRCGHHNVLFWVETGTGYVRSNLVNGLPPKARRP